MFSRLLLLQGWGCWVRRMDGACMPWASTPVMCTRVRHAPAHCGHTPHTVYSWDASLLSTAIHHRREESYHIYGVSCLCFIIHCNEPQKIIWTKQDKWKLWSQTYTPPLDPQILISLDQKNQEGQRSPYSLDYLFRSSASLKIKIMFLYIVSIIVWLKKVIESSNFWVFSIGTSKGWKKW